MEYIVDGKNMTDRRASHEEIARALKFPPYYGHNLDALFDLLSTFEGKVVIRNSADALNATGAYGLSVFKTFLDAKEENSLLTVIFQ